MITPRLQGRSRGRGLEVSQRTPVTIVATAIALGVPVVTQDDDDVVVAGLDVIRV